MLTKRRVGLVLAAAATAAMLSVVLVAAPEQPQPERSPDLAQGVRDLNRSMQEIASLLREQLRSQQADVLMKRMEIKGRALSAQEQELRGTLAERNSLSDGLKEVQARMEQLNDEADLQTTAGVRRPEAELARERAELTLRENLLKERLASADQRVIEVENEVAKRRREIKEWEEHVDAQLESP